MRPERILPALLAAASLAAPAALCDEPEPTLPEGPFPTEYVIDVRLDEATMTLHGEERATFRNLSERPLDVVPFHLYPNAWANTNTPWIQDARGERGVLARGAEDGGYLHVLSVADGAGADLADATTIEGTVMRVRLPSPLAKGESVVFDIRFETKLPRIFARMGKIGRHVNAMQWFPKIAAHVDGRFVDWPFRNPSEFFADFGRYRVTIDVPDDYVVGATGMPTGPAREEGGRRIQTFTARAVHDFAWCANPHFVVHSARSAAGTEILLLNQPFLEPKAQLVLDVTRFAIDTYGEWFFPYPYPRVTIDVEPHGAGGGMEYPTLFTISSRTPEFLPWLRERSRDPAGVTVHEFGHQYWYGMVATNEFEEAWLDEGVNTYVTYKVLERFFGERGKAPGLPLMFHERVYLPLLDRGSFLARLAGWEESPFFSRLGRRYPGAAKLFGFSIPALTRRGFPGDPFAGRKPSYVPYADVSPLETISWEVYRARGGDAYRSVAYSKPALMLRTLEGLEGFDGVLRLLRTWARRNAFRHPTGEQFLALAGEIFEGRHDRWLRQCAETSAWVDWAVEDARVREVKEAQGFLLPTRPGGEVEARFPEEESRRPPGFFSALWARLRGALLRDAGDSDMDEADGAAEESGRALRQYVAEVVVKNRGDLRVPTVVELRFEDGSTERRKIDPASKWTRITTDARPARLVEAVVDPDHAIALDLDVVNNSRLVRPDRGAARALAETHQYWVQNSLFGLLWFF